MLADFGQDSNSSRIPIHGLTQNGKKGIIKNMSVAKKAKKIIELDERGRITLPKDMRQGVASFSVEPQRDGTLHLVPQKTVTLGEAELLESLRKSASEFKKGQTKKVPSDWID